MALRLSLIGEATGQPIGTLQAFLRDICHIVDSITCYTGWLFPLWDSKRQTLADKIMRTVVIPAA
jgi:RDD family